jgi:hypothetical protein
MNLVLRQKLAAALVDETGNPRTVARIEVDMLGPRQFRWTLWSGDRRLFSMPGSVEDVEGMLACTRALIGMMLGLQPAAW